MNRNNKFPDENPQIMCVLVPLSNSFKILHLYNYHIMEKICFKEKFESIIKIEIT